MKCWASTIGNRKYFVFAVTALREGQAAMIRKKPNASGTAEPPQQKRADNMKSKNDTRAALRIDTPPCACEVCRASCKRPCWPTPNEARRLIGAGYARRLMLVNWAGNEDNINIISPALAGREGTSAPSWPSGRCTFQNASGLCELHDAGMKPYEGRVTDHEEHPAELHEEIAIMWNNKEGHMIVALWKDTLGKK